MIYNIQIILEHQNDVIRNINISFEKSLEDLHYAIIEALKLDKNEIASFYITNNNFELLEEITLFKIDENTKLIMNEVKIESIFENTEKQLLYVYDFLKMWRFSISLISKSNKQSNKTKVTNSIGEMPEKTPEISFQSNNTKHYHEEDVNNKLNEFNEFEY